MSLDEKVSEILAAMREVGRDTRFAEHYLKIAPRDEIERIHDLWTELKFVA